MTRLRDAFGYSLAFALAAQSLPATAWAAHTALFVTDRDSVTVLSLDGPVPQPIATLQLPASPALPFGAAVSPDGRFALVTSGDRLEGGAAVPDDRVSMIDLTAGQPRLAQQLSAGPGASGVAIAPEDFALVSNRSEGTLSLFTPGSSGLEPGGKIDLGNAKAGPAGIAISPDGKTALLARAGDNLVSLLHLDKASVTIDPHALTTGAHPTAIVISGDGKRAAVTNLGSDDNDSGSVSLVDLTAAPLKVIDTATIGRQPSGLAFSPDGRVLAVSVAAALKNGTNQGGPALILFASKGQRLRKLAAAPLPAAANAIAFLADGQSLVVQAAGDPPFLVFHWAKGKLTPVASGEAAPDAARH